MCHPVYLFTFNPLSIPCIRINGRKLVSIPLVQLLEKLTLYNWLPQAQSAIASPRGAVRSALISQIKAMDQIEKVVMWIKASVICQ